MVEHCQLLQVPRLFVALAKAARQLERCVQCREREAWLTEVGVRKGQLSERHLLSVHEIDGSVEFESSVQIRHS